jgi:hypothetical protein
VLRASLLAFAASARAGGWRCVSRAVILAVASAALLFPRAFAGIAAGERLAGVLIVALLARARLGAARLAIGIVAMLAGGIVPGAAFRVVLASLMHEALSKSPVREWKRIPH